MRVVEIYKARDSVEAHFVCQILEEEGVACRIVGEHIESLYGIATTWNRPSILVSEEDEGRAREILAARLPQSPEDPQPNWVFQYGMRALLVNFTLIAVIFGFYRPFGPLWPGFAWFAFNALLIGNVLAFAYFRKQRRPIEDGESGEDSP